MKALRRSRRLGGYAALVLSSDGTVRARGNNWFGQLGNGTDTASSTLVQVPGLASVTQVSAGAGYRIAVRSASGVSLPSQA
jgi:alpha-tubulin suppressor-like RCC1 family protein